MNKGKGVKVAAAALAVWLGPSLSLHAGSAGRTGFLFLKTSPYPRSAAMAEATSAFVGDALLLHSNPAGLAHMAAGEASFQHVSHYQDMSYDNLGVVIPYKRGGWGVSVGVGRVGDIVGTKYDPAAVDRFTETGELDAGSRLLSVSWGRRHTSNLALGGTLKIAQETLDSESAVSVLADAGGIYRINRRWRAALVLQNAGTSGKYISQSVPPPLRARAGAHWSPEKWMQWGTELVHHFEGGAEWRVGGELNWNQMGFFRFGYKYGFESSGLGPEAGAAVGVGVQVEAFRADYAFLPFGDLGDSHRISVGWRFAVAH